MWASFRNGQAAQFINTDINTLSDALASPSIDSLVRNWLHSEPYIKIPPPSGTPNGGCGLCTGGGPGIYVLNIEGATSFLSVLNGTWNLPWFSACFWDLSNSTLIARLNLTTNYDLTIEDANGNPIADYQASSWSCWEINVMNLVTQFGGSGQMPQTVTVFAG